MTEYDEGYEDGYADAWADLESWYGVDAEPWDWYVVDVRVGEVYAERDAAI